jgi:hypothetical protein
MSTYIHVLVIVTLSPKSLNSSIAKFAISS